MNKQRTKLSLSNDWATPWWLFRYLSVLYGPYLLDAAAAAWNAKLERFYTARDNGLVRPWARRTFINPPYSKGMKEAFTARARDLVIAGDVELATLLLPHDTSDGYWKRVVRAPEGKLLGISAHASSLGWVTQLVWQGLTVEITEVWGRMQYRHRGGVQDSARHSTAVVTFAAPGVLEPLELGDVRSQLDVSTFGRRAA